MVRCSNFNSNYIFIIGLGRSGTHFLGRAIGKHPEVQLLLEESKTFSLVQKVTIFNNSEKYFNKLLKRYIDINKKSEKPWILEKSHPNIWITEKLIEKFPKSYFFGINRDVYQVLSSMLKHGKSQPKSKLQYLKHIISKKLYPNKPQNVTSWFDLLPMDKPSKFLGINEHNISYYKSLPIEAKIVIRWLSHKYELERLSKKNPNRVFCFDYTNFCLNMDYHLDIIAKITNLDHKRFVEYPNLTSLNKYKTLSDNQIRIVKETLEREEPIFRKLYGIKE